MVTAASILQDITAVIEQALTLTVGRMGDEGVESRRLLLDRNAANRFQEQCQTAHTTISDREPASYATTAELDDGEFFIIDDEETLEELSEFRLLADNIGDIPTVSPDELDLTIKLYAVTLGDDVRIIFVRRANPRMPHRRGRILAIGQERLRLVEEPTFSFSPDFDFVLGPNWAVVLNQKSFEMLFRQIGLVEKHVSTWITGITDNLPMDQANIDLLRDVALRDSRTWRKLREIKQRGHLADVSLDDVRKYATAVGLDPNTVVVDDKLAFDPEERFGFLHLLNEDLYKGPLTDEVFEAHRKAAVD